MIVYRRLTVSDRRLVPRDSVATFFQSFFPRVRSAYVIYINVCIYIYLCLFLNIIIYTP